MAGQRKTATFDLDDKAFNEAFEKALGDLRLNTREQLINLGDIIVDKAQNYCPVDQDVLRPSIQSVPGEDAQGFYIDVGTDVAYAARVEFGYDDTDSLGRTYDQAAQPYLRPAMLEAANEWPPEAIEL